MLKKILFINFFFLLFNLTLSYSAEKIVYLDIDFILNQSKPAKSIIIKIEKAEKKEILRLKSIEKDLKKENEEIKKTKNLISEEEFVKKVNDFKKKLSDYENNKKKVVLSLNEKKKEELNKLLDLINPIIQKYMDKNSIDVIIDKKNVYMAKKNYDITNEILQLVNKEIK